MDLGNIYILFISKYWQRSMSRLKGVIGGGVSLCAAWALSGVPVGYQKVGKSAGDSSQVAYCTDEDQKPLILRASLIKGYQDWLESRGIDTRHVELQAEQHGDESGSIIAVLSSAGARLFNTKWFGLSRIANIFTRDPVLLSFPTQYAVSQDSSEVSKALSLEGDYRIVAHLLVEKLKGDESYLHPWISVLPQSFSTPVCWTEEELQWLQGTSLHRGIMLKRKALEHSWEELKPICDDIARAQGLRLMPTFEDFIWAAAAFQRLAIPLQQKGADHEFSIQILPGTDILRPSLYGDCKWDINRKEESLCAVCSRRKILAKRGNTPLTVSVDNDLSMEQVIFQYGVIGMDADREVLMINCPVPPPEQWDATLKKRIALLLENGLGPQLFLSQRHYESIALPRDQTKMGESERQHCFSKLLPTDALKTLEIFVMDADEFEESKQKNETNSVSEKLKASGMRMAVMTTIVRLLELKLHTLQDEENGTGTLESDELLLKALSKQEDTVNKHCMAALRHRMAQKALAKSYLKVYSEYLQEEMRHLHRLQNAL